MKDAILVCDDEPTVLAMVVALVEQFGRSSTSVNTGVTVPDGCTSLIERDGPPVGVGTATQIPRRPL